MWVSDSGSDRVHPLGADLREFGVKGPSRIDVSSDRSNTPTMSLLRQNARILLTLFCILAVTLRVSGAHLHYCLDGSEPPMTVHFGDDLGLHHVGAAQSSAKHTDIDVSLTTEALVKKSTFDGDLTALLAIFVCLSFLLLQLRQSPVAFHPPLPVRARSPHLRPPLRGPPR